MSTFNTENRLVGCKKEAVEGIAEVLDSADYNVRVREAEISTLEVEYSDSSKYLDGTHTHTTVTPGIARSGISQSVNLTAGEFIATGSAGSPLWTEKLPYDKLLYSAGLIKEATVPTSEGTSDGVWEFYPALAGDSQTVTATMIDISTSNGVSVANEYKIAGAMSTLKIGVDGAGKPFMLDLETKGKVSSVTELNGAEVPVFDDANALATLSNRMLNTIIRITELNYDGSDAGNTPIEFCVNKYELDTGNTVSEIVCQSDAFGIKQNIVTGREPMVSFSPLLQKLSNWEFFGALSTETVFRLEMLSYSDSAKTTPALEIVAPRAQLIKADGTDDGGFRRLDQQFRLLKNLQGLTSTDKQKDFTVKIYGKTVDNTTI